MQRFDRDLGRIEKALRKAHVLKQTLFVITADHGMSPIWRFIPRSVVTNAVTRAGTSAPAISCSNGAYVWLRNPSKAALVAQNMLAAHDPGVQSVYYLTTVGGKPRYVRAGGVFVNAAVDTANQYLLDTMLNGHQLTVVAFARNHATFSLPTTHWRADHGGASFQSQHIPLILAGPGIRRGAVTDQAAQLMDVAPTILQDMGVSPTGMEGHILADALKHPTAAEWAERTAEMRMLNPLVNALMAQDGYESTHP